jgi:hypothetical protein
LPDSTPPPPVPPAPPEDVIVEEPAPVEQPVASAPETPTHGHAQDYSWLSGELERSRQPRGWRLRYSPLDEEDTYGGSVILVGEGAQLDSLQEGQQVRVTGHLVNADAHKAGSPFRVQTLQVLSR